MTRDELDELHYITSIANVASILRTGILSYARAKHLSHVTLADHKVQQRRAGKRVPGGLPLHDYVNLYICARNPMLYRVLDGYTDVCVLRVSTGVLDLPGVVVTDMNAAKDIARFAPAPDGISIVDKDLTFAEYWTDADPAVADRRKGAKCAEVLVPHQVERKFVLGAYVPSLAVKAQLEAFASAVAVIVCQHLFFK